jgi:hypothetical protein
MGDISKITARKLANSEAVRSALEVQGPSIAAKAQPVLFPGEGAPDLIAMVTRLTGTLQSAEDGLRDAEAAYLAERTDNDAVRHARDDAQAELSEVLVGAKSLISATYGERYASRVGLGDPIESRAALIAAQARNAARLVASTEPPAPKLGANVDRAALASAIDAAAAVLEQALRDLAREEREDQQAMVRRDDAAEKWDRAYSAVASVLVAFARAAGEDALADRVHPTDRRRLGLEDPPAEDNPATPVDPGPAADPTST